MSNRMFPDDGDEMLYASPGQAGGAQPPPTRYKNHVDWFVDWQAYMYSRKVGGERHWCRFWFQHREANGIVHWLWRSWEHLRLDGQTGMAVWWRDFCRPLMAELMDPNGTFRNCTPDEEGHFIEGVIDPLPTAPVTAELIDVPVMDYRRAASNSRISSNGGTHE